jgi:hypothetical protein
MTPQEELLALIDKFISGENRSLQLAGQIEGLVLEFFSDAPWFDDLSLSLAQYSPGSGRNYLNDKDLAQELATVAEAIRE